jgi:hypothetical protein
VLKHLLSGLVEIHKNPSLLDNFLLQIGSHVKRVNLRVPVAFVIADTIGADQLCGRYLSYAEGVSRLHRACLCPPGEASNTKAKCKFVNMDAMMQIIDSENYEQLSELSQHYIPDHAFRNIDFGSNSMGIYGATPNDILHGINLGIVQYVLEIFMADDLTDSSRHHLDRQVKLLLPHLRQGGNSSFPRLYFPNGITALSKITAEECIGILFTSYVVSITHAGKDALLRSANMSVQRIEKFISAFERLLLFHAWVTRKDGFWCRGDLESQQQAMHSISKMMRYICSNFTRKSEQGWNLSKMHELLHYPLMIEQFGSPLNYDCSPCERMHKDMAKRPGRMSQKNHSTFNLQAARRLADSIVVDAAATKMGIGTDQSTDLLVDESVSNDSPNGPQLQPSQFNLFVKVSYPPRSRNAHYDVKVSGHGQLWHVSNLHDKLYPDLIPYLLTYYSQQFPDVTSFQLCCCSEAQDESGVKYRAHHDYRSGGIWYDWAWISYCKDNSPDGFTNVPGKLICFISRFDSETRVDDTMYAVCHPCQWSSKQVTSLTKRWTLQPPRKDGNAGGGTIPYDVVPMHSLAGHVLIVPDLRVPNCVFEILPRERWAEKFMM